MPSESSERASPAIEFRPVRAADIEAGLQLCRASRWNQTARDWTRFLAAEPDGAIAAARNGRVLGTVATIRYAGGDESAGVSVFIPEDAADEQVLPEVPRIESSGAQDGGTRSARVEEARHDAAAFAWIGMVLVDPDERGRGLGTSLLLRAVDLLRGVPAIRLDATPAGYELYVKHGFVEEYRLRRMQGIARASIAANVGAAAITAATSAANDAHAIADTDCAPAGAPASSSPQAHADPRLRLRSMTPGDRSAVSAWDARVFGASRQDMLSWMHAGAPEYAWVATRDDAIAGYLFGRHGHRFEHLGPIVATDAHVASALATACLAAHTGREFIIDAACHAPEWTLTLDALGFREQRPFIRMCRIAPAAPAPPPTFGEPHCQFAILGPEFG